MKNVGLTAITATAVGGSLVALVGDARRPRMAGRAPPLRPLPPISPASVPARRDPRIDPLTRFEDVTTYNNFYEFGSGKSDPARHAWTLRPRPWSVAITGEVKRARVRTVARSRMTARQRINLDCKFRDELARGHAKRTQPRKSFARDESP